nr:uncharacterized mitochondrial protein AtMg00810-like [Tanacetum cinerariifolium]
MDINIDALYNILKQNQGDVNDAMGLKKKTVVVIFDPLALIAEKTKVSKSKEKVVVSLDSEGSDADDFSKLKKITALLAKAFNRRKFYSNPTNNNLRTSSTSQSANKKQEFVKTDNKKVEKKDDEKKRDMSRVKCYNYKDEQVLLAKDQAWIESSSDSDQEINLNMVFMAQIEKVLSDSEARSSSVDEKISEKRIEKANQQRKDFENQNKDLQDKYDVLKNQATTSEMNNKELNEQLKELIEKNNDLLAQTKQTSSLKPYVPNVILEKIIIDLENEVVSLLEKEKANLETIDSLKSKGFESSENVSSESKNKTENDCLVVEKEYDKEKNPKVIAPGMFKLNVSQCVSQISMSKSSCESNNVEIKLKRKRHLDTFSSVRRPNHISVVWKKKRSSNTSNVDLSAVRETSSAYVCNDAMNVFCDSRMNDLLDDNNFFIFDDKSVRISPVSKMPLRKKPHDSMNVRSKSNSNKSLPRTVHKWLPKLQPLAEPIAKWFPKVKLERRNRTLVEAARTMLTFANLPSFLWAEAIATACFTQNRSIIHKRFDKTPYELMNKRKPNIKFFRVFECRCYLLIDYEDVGKLKAKGDIRMFVGYSKESVAFRIYNKQTRKIHESVNVNFDELSEMASKQFSLEPVGYSQQEGIDYVETFAPVARIEAILPTPMVEQAKLKLDLVGKPVDHNDYRSMIGSLMYVTSSRPDIMFATCMCARYQANPNEHHVLAIKRKFRYLKCTINLGHWYPKDSGLDLTAYSDADHAGSESEYVVVFGCCAQVLWMRTQLTDYGFFYDKVPIYYDSKSAIAISCNP